MARDGTLTGPVSSPMGGFKKTSEEVRAEDAERKAETEAILTRSEVINLFGEKIGELLIEAGYSTIASIIIAKDKDLKDIPGLGKASLEKIRELVPTLYAEAVETPPKSPPLSQPEGQPVSERIRRIKESQQ